MPTDHDATVPAETSIKRRSIPNSSNGRLMRRLEFLREHLRRSQEWAEQKGDFRHRVVEVVYIEAELNRRGVCYRAVTVRNPLIHA
jgi:hypothetical protein